MQLLRRRYYPTFLENSDNISCHSLLAPRHTKLSEVAERGMKMFKREDRSYMMMALARLAPLCFHMRMAAQMSVAKLQTYSTVEVTQVVYIHLKLSICSRWHQETR